MPKQLLKVALIPCLGTLVAGLVWSLAVAEVSPACGVPATADDWQTTPQAQSAVDPKPLCALIDWLNELKSANVHSVLVIRGGKLVFEHYRHGADERGGRPVGDVLFGPEVRHDLASVSKSVTSLLVGIALDRQLLSSVDEPVYRYFPEYDDLRTPERERITLRHLLTMSSGLAWEETIIPYTDPANSVRQMLAAPDPCRFAWEQQPVTPPGEWYSYNSGSTELLGRIVQKVSGQQLEKFATSQLFAPLSIVEFEWIRNVDGTSAASWGLRLRPRDMAKLGQLVLAQGRWGERPIVSDAWARDSLAPQMAGQGLYYYGYQWWLGRSLVHQRDLSWAAAVGLGGQRIFIVPSLDLVVVVTAGMYQSPMQGWVPLGILNRVLRAVH
jgi:CubicO group peptidase (beta-lactamase class C family)